MSETPPFPVPVVRLIIPDNRGRVLLLCRSKNSYGGGSWCLPGGKVDYCQTLEQAMRNELKEETDMELTASRFLFFQDSLPAQEGAMHCLNLYFECSGAGEVCLNHESSDYVWADQCDLTKYTILFANGEALQRYWANFGHRIEH